MMRSLLMLLTAAAMVGCQSSAFQSSGYGASSGLHQGGPGMPPGMAPQQLAKVQPYPGMGPMPGMSAPGAAPHMAAKPGADVQQVGWKPLHGPGKDAAGHVAGVLHNHTPEIHPGAGYPGVHGHGMPHYPKNTMAIATPSTAGMMPMGPGMPGMAGIGAPHFVTGRTQVRFIRPEGMKIAWQIPGPAGGPVQFTPPQLVAPARYNFLQGQMYRLKMSDVPNRAGVELYPTLEVYPGNYKTAAFLSHNSVPIVFTDDDFEQVLAGNYVTKVIYLPDPEFQEMAITIEEIVSTRLDPGVDPVQEAHRRGAILAVIRLGSVDLEMPHSPPLQGPTQMMGVGPGMGPAMAPIMNMPAGSAPIILEGPTSSVSPPVLSPLVVEEEVSPPPSASIPNLDAPVIPVSLPE